MTLTIFHKDNPMSSRQLLSAHLQNNDMPIEGAITIFISNWGKLKRFLVPKSRSMESVASPIVFILSMPVRYNLYSRNN